jgi:5'-nucleotidase
VSTALRILICNDDGVGAPGLVALAEAARRLSAEVWIVAPERKWTAASHQLTFDRDLTLTRIGERSYACSGAPADCVVAAMTILLPGAAKPDLVLSGINDKANVGEDIAYSGTVAIAREAAFWGVPAISFSRTERAIARASDLVALRDLLHTLWAHRADWVQDGHWLAINLPASLPAPLVQARIARDKIAGGCDVLNSSAERITYRLRRGRPGTSTPGDENACVESGAISVLRFCWRMQSPLPDAVVAGWQAGDKMAD